MSTSYILERPARAEVDSAERYFYPESLEVQQIGARGRRFSRELSHAADIPQPKDPYAELGGNTSDSGSPLDTLDGALVDLQPNDILHKYAFENLNAALLFRPGAFSAMTQGSKRLVAAQFRAYIRALEGFSVRAKIDGAADDPIYSEYCFEDDEQAKESSARAEQLAKVMSELGDSCGIWQYCDGRAKAKKKPFQKDFFVVNDSKNGKLRAYTESGKLA